MNREQEERKERDVGELVGERVGRGERRNGESLTELLKACSVVDHMLTRRTGGSCYEYLGSCTLFHSEVHSDLEPGGWYHLVPNIQQQTRGKRRQRYRSLSDRHWAWDSVHQD